MAATGDLPPQRAMPRAAVHRPAPPSRRGFPLTNALIAAVILGGIALIVVGVIRSSGGSDQSESTTAGDGVQEPPQAEPEKPATTAPAAPRAPARPAPAALRRKSFAGRFSIGVPRGWDQRPSEGGVALLADGGAAQVEVFSENPARSPGELADLTRGFLAERHPGARVSRPRPARFGGERALRIDSRYGGGHETAAVLSSGGVSYLVIVRTDETAGPELVQLADSSFLSFRPG